jgi:hypothetical protein
VKLLWCIRRERNDQNVEDIEGVVVALKAVRVINFDYLSKTNRAYMLNAVLVCHIQYNVMAC